MRFRWPALFLVALATGGCGPAQRVTQDGIAAEIVYVSGRPHLMISNEEPVPAAFPLSGNAYIRRDGQKWTLDGDWIDPAIKVKHASVGIAEVTVLPQGASLLIEINSPHGGEVIFDPFSPYRDDETYYDQSLRSKAAKGQLRLWDRKLIVGRLPS